MLKSAFGNYLKSFYFCYMASETERKYNDIRKEYEKKWLKKRYRGVMIHTPEYIYAKLGEQFYLSPKTIENIICYRTKLIAS